MTRVVRLGDQRPAAALEALDRPTSPTAAWSGRAAGRRSARRACRAAASLPGRGQRGLAHVVLEVEARVVDPDRPAGLERREAQPLAVARHEVQAPADDVEEVAERRRRALEDRQRADVHVRRGALLREERRVDRGQPVEVLLGHAASSSLEAPTLPRALRGPVDPVPGGASARSPRAGRRRGRAAGRCRTSRARRSRCRRPRAARASDARMPVSAKSSGPRTASARNGPSWRTSAGTDAAGRRSSARRRSRRSR